MKHTLRQVIVTTKYFHMLSLGICLPLLMKDTTPLWAIWIPIQCPLRGNLLPPDDLISSVGTILPISNVTSSKTWNGWAVVSLQ